MSDANKTLRKIDLATVFIPIVVSVALAVGVVMLIMLPCGDQAMSRDQLRNRFFAAMVILVALAVAAAFYQRHQVNSLVKQMEAVGGVVEVQRRNVESPFSKRMIFVKPGDQEEEE